MKIYGSEIGNIWELLTIKAHIAHNKSKYLGSSGFERQKINPAGQKGGNLNSELENKYRKKKLSSKKGQKATRPSR